MINHSYDNPRLEFPYLQSYPVTEEFSSVTCFVANFRHFVKNILKKNKFLSWLGFEILFAKKKRVLLFYIGEEILCNHWQIYGPTYRCVPQLGKLHRTVNQNSPKQPLQQDVPPKWTCIEADFASNRAYVQAPALDLENKSWKELQEKSDTQILWDHAHKMSIGILHRSLIHSYHLSTSNCTSRLRIQVLLFLHMVSQNCQSGEKGEGCK